MKKLSFIVLSIFTFSTYFFLTETVVAKSKGYRSSITGKFTTKSYANSHKSTTQSFKRK